MFAEEMNDNVTLECCVQEVIFQRDGVKVCIVPWAWHCFLGCTQQSHLIKTKLMLRNKYVVKCADVRQLLWLNVILRSLKRFQTNVPWISLSEEVPFKMSVIVLNLRRVVLTRLCCGEFIMSIPKSKYCHNLLTLNQYVCGTQKIDQNKLKLFFHSMWYRN